MKYRIVSSNLYDGENGRHGIHRSPSGTISGIRIPRTVYLVVAILFIGILLTALNVYELRSLQRDHWERSHSPTMSASEEDQEESKERRSGRKPVAWIRGNNLESGYLDHVIDIFGRLGFEHTIKAKETDWDVLWHHDYPFLDDELRPLFTSLKPHQKINHVPGSGYYTSKVSLATQNASGVPPAFSLPSQRDEFLAFASSHPEKYWVQKDNNHRGIQVKQIQDLDLSQKDSFVQEYVSAPLLIDKRKFDIGIYTVITSVQPLRVYTFEGEALLRFCPEDYHPFDPKNLNKYVVHDDYTPVWELPSLKKYYVDHGYSRKESLNAYLRLKKLPAGDPSKIWNALHRTIREILLAKSPYFIDLVRSYKHSRNFFELSRFDFVIDENFNVYLMEANMSPNLSSSHFPANKLLYEQVIFNLLALVGVGRLIHSESLRDDSDEERQMRVSMKDIQVYPDYCAAEDSRCTGCSDWKCKLCSVCLTDSWRRNLMDAYLEHQNRQSMRRVVPEPLSQEFIADENKFLDYLSSSSLNEENRLMAWWFRGKCLQDSTWCT